MKKLLVLCLCFALCLPVTACSSKEAAPTLHVETLGSNLDSGKFMVDEQEFSFPTVVSDWTDNGWHVSNNYSNKNSFVMEPMVETSTFELYKDDTQKYVRMMSYNNTDENVNIEGGITSFLRLTFSSNKEDLAVELPGGVTVKSKMDDIVAVYGEPLERDDEVLKYTVTIDDWICDVEFSYVGERIVAVEYKISDDNWGSVKTPEELEAFADEALKTSFYGDYATYVEKKFDTEEGAQQLYNEEIDYYAKSLMAILGVDYTVVEQELIDEEVLNEYRELAKQIFMKFKWDKPVFKTNEMSDFAVGDAIVGDLEFTLYPTDFLDIVYDDAVAVMEAFGNEHSDVDPDSLSDEEYASLESEYASNILEAIRPKVDEISYREPIVKICEIDTSGDNPFISDADWNEIDDILMDFGEAEE